MSSTTTDPWLTARQAAFLVFGPQHYELYKQWLVGEPHVTIQDDTEGQLCNEEIEECGDGELPKPRAYTLFHQWLSAQGKLYPPRDDLAEPPTTLRLAMSCLHPLHPGFTDQGVDGYPVCVAWQATESLKRVWDTWLLFGGPDRNVSTEEQCRIYRILKSLWRLEKKRWANLVNYMEHWGVEEERWEDMEMINGQYTSEELDRVQSCRAAVQLAWEQNVGAVGYNLLFIPGTPPSRPSAPFHSQGPMQASPPHLPSSPSIDPVFGAWVETETTPAALSEEEPRSLPLLPGSSPTFPALELPEDGRNDLSPEYELSEAPLESSSPLCGTLPSERKSVTISDDVQDHPQRPAALWNRSSEYYAGNGRHVAPDGGEWVDTSFQHNQDYWDREQPDQSSASEGDYDRVKSFDGASDDDDSLDDDYESQMRIAIEQMLNATVATTVTTQQSPEIAAKAVEAQAKEDPEAGYAGSQVLGRRYRDLSESVDAEEEEGGEVKRQRIENA